jgi:hypothetical protein
MRISLEPLDSFHRRFFAVLADSVDIDELVAALRRIDEPPESATRKLASDRGRAALAIADHYAKISDAPSARLASAWLSIAARSNDMARLILAARLRNDRHLMPSFARILTYKINRLLGDVENVTLAPLADDLRTTQAILTPDGDTAATGRNTSAHATKPESGTGKAGQTTYKHAVTVLAPGCIATSVGDRDLKEGLKSFKALEEPIELRAAPTDWRDTVMSFPWFAEVIDRIARQIAYAPDQPVRLRPMLIVGPPGIGKTAFARALGAALRLPFRGISFAAQSDTRGLLGTSRGWGSAHPSLVVEELRRSRCANPLFFVDEIEKGSAGSINGDPQMALLTFVERENARTFEDPYLQAPVDLSYVNWIAGANSLHGLAQPLLSRFEVIEIQPPRETDWPVLQTSMLAAIAADFRLPQTALPRLSPEIDQQMRKLLRRRRDLRAVRRALERVVQLELEGRTLN